MFDTPIKFQVGFFASASDIAPDSKVVFKIISEISEKTNLNFVPTLLTEFGGTGVAKRLRLVANSDTWLVTFGSSRIDVEHQHSLGAVGTDVSDFKDFCKIASDVLEVVTNNTPRLASRVSFIATYLSSEIGISELNAAYLATVKPMPLFSDKEPFEWNVRSVYNAPLPSDDEEKLNIIAEIKRVQGQMQINKKQKEFDRLCLTVDINTVAENPLQRFTTADTFRICGDILPIHDQIHQQASSSVSGQTTP